MPRVLVLALDNWLGASRLPSALQKAGFEVSLLCYPNTLISLTRFVDDKDLCLPTDPAEVVASRLIHLIRSRPMRMIIPSDDRALRFLQHIVEVERLGMLPEDLTRLVRASLADPSAFKLGNDKEAACALMDQLGFRTPKRERIFSKADLREFVAEVGLPVVIKPLSGTAGMGVQILHTPEDVETARISPDSQWMAQQYVVGKSCACAGVALEGRCLARIAFEKTVTHPGETGPATIVTRIDQPEMLKAATEWAKATRWNGFFSLGHMVEEATGDAFFIECNARLVPIVPSAAKLGIDVIGALYARIAGAPAPEEDPDAPRRLALYPQELHRDPASPHRGEMLDEPTDDPALHSAMERGIRLLAAAP